MKTKLLSTTLILLGSMGFAFAEEEAKWSGTGHLGLTTTSGNSDTENITAGLSITRESGKWLTSMGIDILSASADGVDTADRFVVNSKTGYKFDDNDYIYYGSRYENDNFSGFDYTLTYNIGWGHKFVDTEKNRMISELGIGHKTEAIDIDRSENAGVAFVGKFDYMRKLTDTMSFVNLTLVESTDDNTFIQNDAGLSFKVSDKFAVKLAHQLRHFTEAPVGKKSTDTLVSANLVYDF